MTVVDSSVIIAILRDEPDAGRFIAALDAASDPRMSAASYVEAAIVVDSARDPVASRRFDELVAEAALVIEPVTQAQARMARDAYRDFGRGSGHKAGLNFGDCFTYALAKATGEPLLFKGDDFPHTDVTPALSDDGP
jgi:ribonuclease VapC